MNITSGILILLLSSLITFNVQGQSRKDFILKYKHIAIQEMERTGIPASITLAQGIFESGCGFMKKRIRRGMGSCVKKHFGSYLRRIVYILVFQWAPLCCWITAKQCRPTAGQTQTATIPTLSA